MQTSLYKALKIYAAAQAREIVRHYLLDTRGGFSVSPLRVRLKEAIDCCHFSDLASEYVDGRGSAPKKAGQLTKHFGLDSGPQIPALCAEK